MEKQRLRFHFNIKEYQLCRFVRQAFKSRYPIVTLMQILESRVDNVLWRVGLVPTMAAGKNFLGSQNVQYRKNTPKYAGKEDGWRTMIGPHVMLGIGDQIRVRPDTEWSHKKARKTLEE